MLSSQAVLAGCWTALCKLCHGFEKYWPSLNVRTWIYYLSVSGRKLAHRLIPMQNTLWPFCWGEKHPLPPLLQTFGLGWVYRLFLCRRSMAYRRVVELSQSARAVSCTTIPRKSWSSGENSVWGFPDFGSHTICHTPRSACHWCQEKQPSTTHCTRAIQCFTCFFFEQVGNREQFLQPLTWRRGMRP